VAAGLGGVVVLVVPATGLGLVAVVAVAVGFLTGEVEGFSAALGLVVVGVGVFGLVALDGLVSNDVLNLY